MIVYDVEQGSEEWLETRRGVITASAFADIIDRTKKGDLTAKALLARRDVARERLGGLAQEKFQSKAMRIGQEQESLARDWYAAETGAFVQTAGFVCTDDRWFGASVDGLVDEDGTTEIKTMVSSNTLWDAWVGLDVSEYRDQVMGQLWITGRHWCDVVLWAGDMPEGQRGRIVRLYRDDTYIEGLEAQLLLARGHVISLCDELTAAMTAAATGERIVQPVEVQA